MYHRNWFESNDAKCEITELKSKLKKHFSCRSKSMWSYWVKFEERKCSIGFFFEAIALVMTIMFWDIHHQSQHWVSTIFRKVPSISVNLLSNTGLPRVQAEITAENIYLFVMCSYYNIQLGKFHQCINRKTFSSKTSCLRKTILKEKCNFGEWLEWQGTRNSALRDILGLQGYENFNELNHKRREM